MADVTTEQTAARRSRVGIAGAIPPHAYFLVSAVFHYLGPAFAVLLFAHVGVLGVAWLRIASAAAVFAAWRRPWRLFAQGAWTQRRLLIALGVVLGLMNACFYLAIARLPLGTVGAIEYLGSLVLAALGARTRRNAFALGLAVVGVGLLTNVRLGGQPLGFALAFANGALFMLYVVLGHRIARDGGDAGIERLGAAMLVALVTVTPLGIAGAAPAFAHPPLLLAGIGVGICSSVIPYVCDQLAMARLPRATFRPAALLAACVRRRDRLPRPASGPDARGERRRRPRRVWRSRASGGGCAPGTGRARPRDGSGGCAKQVTDAVKWWWSDRGGELLRDKM